ncbi:MAG: endonuclease III [Thermodesulfobacteriota bacterium]|jgi:endonuclease-3
MAPSAARLAEKARAVYDRLGQAYGIRPWKPRRDALRELISTILSHRTRSADEWAAMDRLWQTCGSWEAIRDAPVEAIEQAICGVSWPERKAPHIKNVLRMIAERRNGDFRLDFLKDLPAEEAMAWLRSLPGVGVKTASLLLLFNFRQPVLPVDTHVHRVSQRIGLIDAKTTPEKAHELLPRLLPRDPDVYWNFHLNMIRHGREVCVWGRPRCERCVLTDLCDYYATVVRPQKPPA